MGGPLKSKPERVCQNCNKLFIAVSCYQKFCSKKCTYQYHNKNRSLKPNIKYKCVVCGKIVEKYIEPSKQKISAMKYCSRQCKGKDMSGSKHPMWKGGRKQNNQGYIFIYEPKHPGADKKGYVREHRLIMEDYIGRLLKTEEVVHHRNDNTSDNRIENLVLFKNQIEHKKYHESFRSKNNKGQYERKL